MTATLTRIPGARRRKRYGPPITRTYPKGRRCALGMCGCDAPAVLSIYNPDATCAVCTPKLDQEVRRAEPLEPVEDDHVPTILRRDDFVINRVAVEQLQAALA